MTIKLISNYRFIHNETCEIISGFVIITAHYFMVLGHFP
jgi:hypothetical protein